MARTIVGHLLPGAIRIYPRGSTVEAREKSLEELVRRDNAPSIAGKTGGKTRAANQKISRDTAFRFVRDKYVRWRGTWHEPNFQMFWDLEGRRVYKELKEIDANAATVLRAPAAAKSDASGTRAKKSPAKRKLELLLAKTVFRNIRRAAPATPCKR
jgi:hypothetical protein